MKGTKTAESIRPVWRRCNTSKASMQDEGIQLC